MGYLPALGGKAAHLVSDLATVILNPVSERERQRHHPSHLPVSSSRAASSLLCPQTFAPEGRSLCSGIPVSFPRMLCSIRAIRVPRLEIGASDFCCGFRVPSLWCC